MILAIFISYILSIHAAGRRSFATKRFREFDKRSIDVFMETRC